MVRRGLGTRARKLVACVGAAAAVFALGYAANGSHSAGRLAQNGVALHAPSALKTKQAEKALVALLKNSKPYDSIDRQEGARPNTGENTRKPWKEEIHQECDIVKFRKLVWICFGQLAQAQEYTKVYGSDGRFPEGLLHIGAKTIQRLGRPGRVGMTIAIRSSKKERPRSASRALLSTTPGTRCIQQATVEVGTTAAAGDAITASVTRIWHELHAEV